MSSFVASAHVMCSIVSRLQKLRAALAMAIELVSSLPPGFPATCHVTSQKRGPPVDIRSSLPMRFVAPSGVRGGKNSSEKKWSPPFMRAWIFSTSERGIADELVGEDERGVCPTLLVRDEEFDR